MCNFCNWWYPEVKIFPVKLRQICEKKSLSHLLFRFFFLLFSISKCSTKSVSMLLALKKNLFKCINRWWNMENFYIFIMESIIIIILFMDIIIKKKWRRNKSKFIPDSWIAKQINCWFKYPSILLYIIPQPMLFHEHYKIYALASRILTKTIFRNHLHLKTVQFNIYKIFFDCLLPALKYTRSTHYGKGRRE